MNQNKAQAHTKLVHRYVGGLVAANPTVSSSFLENILVRGDLRSRQEMQNPSNTANKILSLNTNLHVS